MDVRSGEWLRDGESECVQWRRRLPPGINLHTGGFDIRDAIACRARFLRGTAPCQAAPPASTTSAGLGVEAVPHASLVPVNSNEAPENAQAQADDTPEQIQVRLAKRQRMIDEGLEPYPVELPVTATIPEIRSAYTGLGPGEELADVDLGVAGRVMLTRSGGKIAFATLQDGRATASRSCSPRRTWGRAPSRASRPTSTWATTCSSKATSGRPSAGSSPCSPTPGGSPRRPSAPCPRCTGMPRARTSPSPKRRACACGTSTSSCAQPPGTWCGCAPGS